MATYAVESSRQPMTATGIVEAINEWVQGADGKRRPSDTQARDEETGMPLWGVEVFYLQTSFGRQSTLTTKVAVGAETEPRLAPWTRIEFTGLRVEARTNKAGGFVEAWSAEAIAEASKPASEKAPDKVAPANASGSEKAGGEKAGAGRAA